MKVLTRVLVWFFVSMSILTTVFAADDLGDFLNDIDTNRWYTTGIKLTIQEKWTNYIVVQSPIIKKDSMIIKQYTVTYSEKSIDQLDLAVTKDTGFTFTGSDLTGTTLSFKIWELDPTKTYYLIITPKDSSNVSGEPSEQISFKLSDALENTNSAARGPSQMHSAAADMSLANISHTLSWNTVTLTWTPQSSAPSIELFLRHVNDSTFRSLGKVAMGDGQYQFQTTREGSHFVRFIPLNSTGQPDGKEFIYTVKVTQLASAWDQPESGQGTTPRQDMGKIKVWPTTNIIIVLIGALIIYSMYRLRKMRHQ